MRHTTHPWHETSVPTTKFLLFSCRFNRNTSLSDPTYHLPIVTSITVVDEKNRLAEFLPATGVPQ
jgi:hypothetical protein